MEQNTNNELFNQLNECKKEISELRRQLNEINEQKEHWFEKKESYSKDISRLIRRVKGKKAKRNKFTEKVKESKGEREKYNQEIKLKIDEVKKLNEKKKEVQRKYGITDDPERIRQQIEHIDFSIETEGISFDKEQKLMKVIKDLKKKLKESEKISDVFGKVHKMSKEIDELKKKSEDAHKKVQAVAKESQIEHEGLIESSKDVDDLKQKEEEAFKKFLEFKKQFSEINDKLQEKLILIAKLNEKTGIVKQERRKFRIDRIAEREKGVEEEIQKRGKEVEEKLKSKKKITTKDLLIMQQAMKDIENHK